MKTVKEWTVKLDLGAPQKITGVPQGAHFLSVRKVEAYNPLVDPPMAAIGALVDTNVAIETRTVWVFSRDSEITSNLLGGRLQFLGNVGYLYIFLDTMLRE